MIKIEKLAASKQYPDWIKKSVPFQKMDSIRKVFPQVGLDDYTEKVCIDNNGSKITALLLVEEIQKSLNERIKKVKTFLTKTKTLPKRLSDITLVVELMAQLSGIQDLEKFIVYTPKGTISLVCPISLLSGGKAVFKAGISLFKVYNRLSEMLADCKLVALQDLEKNYHYKIFSSTNLPVNTCTLHFSSSTEEGVWDIATMSMRGITSCQTWQGANNYAKLIGSIVDPCTAVIYLTNGTPTDYGTKMVRRSLVRYVHNVTNGKPCLVIERMYPAFDQGSLDIFINSLSSRFKGEIEFVDCKKNNDSAYLKGLKYIIPISPEIQMLDDKHRPYIDSSLAFASHNDASIKDESNIKLQFVKFFEEHFNKYFKGNRLKKEYGIDPASNAVISNLKTKAEKRKILIKDEKILAKDYSLTIASDLATILFDRYSKAKYRMYDTYGIQDSFYSYLSKLGVSDNAASRMSYDLYDHIFVTNRIYA